MTLLFILGCAGAEKENPWAESDTDTDTDSDTDTDTDADPFTGGFRASGTFQGASLAVDCSPVTAVAGYARSGEDQIQVSAGCYDTSVSAVPYVTITVSGDQPVTYSDCSLDPGDATIQVGTSSPNASDSCVLNGTASFDVVFTSVDDSVIDVLTFAGTMHWESDDGSTTVNGEFDVSGECTSGC